MIDPLFYNNDTSIDNKPSVGSTVTDDDNKYGVICDRSDDDNSLPLPPESQPLIIMPCMDILKVADFETPLFHQDEGPHSAVNDNINSVYSNGKMVEGSRYNLNVNASSNLDDVAATANATADVFDNAKYQSSAVVVLKTTPVVISTETV